MTVLNTLVLVCLGYVVFLFLIAFAAERAAARGRGGWLRAPIIYTLSLSIYCTAWTFYGAVGYAARSGMEFVTIYLGPSLVMFGWWWVLRKLVRIGRTQRVTSIADLISSRFGKSNSLAIFITVMAVIGVTPYIALQLQSVTLSLSVFAESDASANGFDTGTSAFWIALGLALFTLLFGTRSLNTHERQHGIVIAIAAEAVVKLVALLAVGVFVVWGLGGGPGEMMARIDASEIGQWQVDRSRWAALTFLAAVAFLCLPRMFQVMVVENDDDRQVQLASWLFPVYLMLMSLFVVPIAVIGLELQPNGNPDLFVLTLPLTLGQDGLAVLAFLGGFSSATSMVIVATLALATMVSNHIVMPIWLSAKGPGASVSGDVRYVVILSRRLSVGLIIGLGYFYYRFSGGSEALAAMGLISFAGVAQFLPAMLGGIFWRGATRLGALSGLSVGFVIWVWTLLLPSFGGGMLSASVLENGPWGIEWLRPDALFGFEGMDGLVHSVWWSLSLNFLVFWFVSLITFPRPLERLQGAQMVNVFQHADSAKGVSGSFVESDDLLIMAQRILGPQEARALFEQEAKRQGLSGRLAEPTASFLLRLERELAASVGAATAHAMVSQITGGPGISVEDLIAVADESAQILEYSNQLEVKSAELTRTARQLKQANTKLTQLSVQKDAFLSQISHELRTPMTSIRAFSEILRDTKQLGPADQTRYSSIIHDEAVRLTRLLDDLLDLSVLENGQVTLNRQSGSLAAVLDRAVQAAHPDGGCDLKINRVPAQEQVTLDTDLDRLTQVFINLVANARKYCKAAAPELRIEVSSHGSDVLVDFIDNGEGIAEAEQSVIFEKFSRLGESDGSGAGLGLAICAEIMERLGGSITYLPVPEGTAFRVQIPGAQALAAQ